MSIENSEVSTNASLIERVRRPEDQRSWAEFVQRYGQTILHWCRKWNMQDADAKDLTQEVLVRVWKALPTFEYDPRKSFRGWLRTISLNAFRDSIRAKVAAGRSDLELVEDEMDRRAVALAAQVEREFEMELLGLACAEVQRIVLPRDWHIFEATTFELVEPRQLAEKYNLKPASIYVLKQRVREKVISEFKRLESSLNVPRLNNV